MTPMLTLLVGGDIATLQLALNRLQEGLPVVRGRFMSTS